MKISVIGAGQVGSTTALQLVEKGIGNELVLLDIVDGMPQGKGLDMREATPIFGKDVKIYGTSNYEDIKGSDIAILTAGFPRKPGMSRMDLLKANIDIVKPASENIVKYAPNAKLLVVTNPLDIMTYVARAITNFEPNRVFGMAGILDTSRFRAFISMELGISVEDISAMVLGGHGDEMVPLPRFSTISGIPISEFLPKEKIDKIIERTRKAGGEIVSLLKTGSAYYAPGAAVVQMVEAIVNDKKRILPASAYLKGEYGFNDVYAGVPVMLGKNGVEKVIELNLNNEEKEMFKKSVSELTKTIKELKDNKMI
ncbi:MAG: malate dehydrogenase [Candidatus Thermoplasmatota archaeon]